MNPDRYDPPAAQLADPPSAAGDAPPSVRRACRFIIIALLLSLAGLVPGLRADDPTVPPVPLWIEATWVGVFTLLTVWLVVLLLRRRNWARWATLALLGLGWLAFAADFSDIFLRSPVAGMLDVVVTAFEVWATSLLFSGESRAWFRRT